MREIEACIVRETIKYVESLSSAITAALVDKLIDTKRERSVVIYR